MSKFNETKLLRNMSIIPVIIFIVFSLIITSVIINSHNKQLQRETLQIQNDYIELNKDLIKKETKKIINILEVQYQENKVSCKFPEKIIKKNILKLIESMRYDQNGYIFIVDFQGNFLINIKQSLLNENQINLQDINGLNITKEIIKTAKKKQGYISYIGLAGTHKTQTKKISYIEYFKPWGWAVGYGFHPSDIQETINQKIAQLKKEHSKYLYELIFITIGVTLILTIVLLILSRNIENIFTRYKNRIEKTEKTNREKSEIIYHQSKMTIIGELLNMISHQWRQPLSQINAITLSLYLKEKNGLLSEKVLKENINDIENTTQYLSQTIDDFSRFFVQESEEKIFLLNDSVTQCIKIINPSLHHIDLQLEFKSKKYLNGYITLFQQVILSLISNSIEIFNANNITNPFIKIKTYDKKNTIFVEISDNGGGVPEEYLDKIFDIYFSTKTKDIPSGLGLYIVKEIIEKQFHGIIYAQNIPYGVQFTIRIEYFEVK